MRAAVQFSPKRGLVACFLVTALGERAYAAPVAPAVAAIATVDIARHSSVGGTLAPHPAKLRGVVTAFAGWKNSFFLQDETGAIGVDRLEQTPVHIGDEVEVTGTIQPGLFAPLMLNNALQVLGKGNLPAPRVSTYYELSRGNLDSRWVEVSGIVHSAAIGEIWGKQVLFLDLRTSDGGDITVHVIDFPEKGFDRLVDSTVRVWGACGAVPNDHRQIVGVRLFVPDLQDIAVESPAADSSRLPFSSIDSLAQFHPDASLEHCVRIKGTVTFQAPGSMLYLQNNASGIRLETRQRGTFEPGARVEALGFVAADGYSPILEDAIVRRIGPGVAPTPVQLKAAQVISTEDRFARTPYDGLLVHIEGKIIERLPGTKGELWLLEDKTVQFQAELSQFSQNLGRIEPGTLVGLSGICRTEADVRRNPTSFRILLRTEQDITVLRTAYSTVSVVFLVSAAVFIVGIGLLIFWLQEGYVGRASQHVETVLPNHRQAAFTRASKVIAALVGSLGALVLIGWGTGIPFLKSVRPGYPTMQANTALALLAASGALWLADEHAGNGRAALERLFAGVAAAIGSLTLLEYATGWNLHIDELLVQDAGSLIAGSPGRMALLTALSLFLLGGALVAVLHRRLAVLAQLCALLTGAFCLLSLNCYLFGIHEFPGVAVYAALSIHTSGSLLLLSLGVLFCCADSGPMESVSSRAPGGIMASRLLPGVLLVPSVLGWVRWQGQLHGLYDSAFGLALFASANAVCFAFLIWSTAAVLNRLDLGRLRAEAEIRSFNYKLETAATEAESANRAKSTFLSTMSHEIRTPLNAVLGYTQLMLRDPGLSKDSKENLSIIGRSGEHLLNLINEVLDMSKIEAGRTELTPVTFSLSTLLVHLVAMFRVRAEAKGVRFELSADVKATGYVVADEGKIRQVLINLVGNAIKFTARGKIQLDVSIADKGGQLWLVARIQDTGPGISVEDQAKLFEPFMQAKGEPNTQRGTGLGLAISRKYARLMEGDITVTSLPGEGSLFLFEIPVQSGDATAAVRTQAPRRVIGLRTGSETPEILVVDDQLENRDSLMKLLHYVGFSVRGAGSGEEALRITEERKPHMILMDVHMPGMDGLETTRRIKASSRGKDTLIVALTASAMEDDRRMVAASGADDFLAKPCPENVLFEMLRVLLNVTYDYEESTVSENQVPAAAAISAEQLMPLPSRLMEELLDATLEGKKKEMDAVLLKVRETHDAALANRLQDLADGYEYDTLTRILEERVAKERDR